MIIHHLILEMLFHFYLLNRIVELLHYVCQNKYNLTLHLKLKLLIDARYYNHLLLKYHKDKLNQLQ